MTAITTPRRARRTWPQRLLLLLGVVLAGACFIAAKGLWEARTVLADLPRIRVGSDVLAQTGSPGDPVNFLMIGVDSSEGLDEDDPVRAGRDIVSEANGRFLSDTILMVRLDPATGAASVMSIPRDLYVQVPGSSEYKINSTLLIGGVEKLIETIDSNLGVPVNHFVMVDFAGFSSLVELVDGVPVYFPFPTRDLGSGLSIPNEGCWVLDGANSLAYVRARSIEENIDGEWTQLAGPAPDLARISRQQEFMVLALEQALQLGASDAGRIREFVQVGAEAVVLDDRLTPGQLLDLAESFRSFDTDTLSTETLPVAPLFNDEGRYLGEALQVEEADDLLRVFQGRADGVRPAQVVVSVEGRPGSGTQRAVSQLVERGFDATSSLTAAEPTATTIRFSADQLAEALLLARYLELSPAFEAQADSDAIVLEIGPDFGGVRPLPRPENEVIERATAAATLARELVSSPTTTDSSDTTVSGDGTSPTTTLAVDTPAATTAAPQTSTTPIVSDDLPTNSVENTTIVRGRPPEGVTCSSLEE